MHASQNIVKYRSKMRFTGLSSQLLLIYTALCEKFTGTSPVFSSHLAILAIFGPRGLAKLGESSGKARRGSERTRRGSERCGEGSGLPEMTWEGPGECSRRGLKALPVPSSSREEHRHQKDHTRAFKPYSCMAFLLAAKSRKP